MSSQSSRTSSEAPSTRFTKHATAARTAARIEGQVRGLQRMVDEDRACVDIVRQITAVKAALDQVALALVDDHVRRTLDKDDAEKAVGDILDAVARLLRTS
jgi:DNA-binding FrmR family transcriptional regulator